MISHHMIINIRSIILRIHISEILCLPQYAVKYREYDAVAGLILVIMKFISHMF